MLSIESRGQQIFLYNEMNAKLLIYTRIYNDVVLWSTVKFLKSLYRL